MGILGRIGLGRASAAGGEVEVVVVDHDPAITSVDTAKGSIIIRSDTGEHFRKLDDGDTSNVSTPADSLQALANGAVIQTIDIDVIEDTGAVKLQLQKSGGGDLTVQLSGKNFFFDATPVAELTLTAGSDISPTLNFVYIEDVAGTPTLKTSTVGFPATEYAPIATVLVQSAATVATDGAYKVHAWTDALSHTSGMGHLSDLNAWIRNQHATWVSGVVPTSTPVKPGSGPNVYIVTTAGIVFQLHSHAFPARSMPTDPAFVVNDSSVAFRRVTNLNVLLTDSAGGSMSNRHFSLVIWGVVSEDETDCKLMVNLPGGSYGTMPEHAADHNAFTNYTIPADFRGTGFLIAEMRLEHASGGPTWTMHDFFDLRGLQPAISAGGQPGSSTEFADNNFRVFDEGDVTKKLALQLSGITTGTTRVATAPDKNFTLGVDDDAIHDNVNAEINAITEKATPVAADLLLVEDSAASNAKKRVQIGNLPGTVPDIFYAEDDTAEDQSTSTTMAERVSLAFTAEAADYLISWSAEVRSDDTGTSVEAQIDLDNGTLLAEIDYIPDAANGTGYGPFAGTKKVTLTAAAHTIDMDFASGTAAKNVRIRRSRISAVKIVDVT